MRLPHPTVLLALCAAGCVPDPEVTTAELSLRAVPSCPVVGLEGLQLTAAGDFPSLQRGLRGKPPFAFDELPFATQWLAVEGELGDTRAGGMVARDGAVRGAALLVLPFDESCPLGDPAAAGFDGAAVAALDDGSLLIAGGELDSGESTANAQILPAGELLARPVEGGMLLARAGASATAVPAGAVVAGGAPDDTGPAQQNFELFELASGRFGPPHKLADARRDHGAALLADGRVLLVGGVRELGGEPLASAELIDPVVGTAELTGELTQARTQPSVLALDDGSVLVALGRDADGSAVTAVERFDADGERFDRLEVELPAHEEQAVVALEGRRVAYAGCGDAGTDSDACELGLLLPDGADFHWQPSAIAELAGLTQLRLAALRDGQLLLDARQGPRGGAPRAYLIDLARDELTALPAKRAPNALVALGDGTLVELDPFGASLRRHELQSPLHDAPDPVVGDGAAHVALDLATRWDPDAGLTALEPARFDLPALRFAALRVELALTGAAELLLEPDAAPPVAVQLQDDEVRVAGGECKLARPQDEPVVLEREGSALHLRAGGESARCELPELSHGRVGLALEATHGTQVQRLRVLRQ